MYRDIINERVKCFCEDNNIDDKDYGFLKFVNDLFLNGLSIDIKEADECIVDGNGDKQVDLIQIEEDEEKATIRIIQVKNTKGFESNIVILLKNGLDWIFNRDIEEVIKLKNSSFKDRILEVRELFNNKSLSFKNIFIEVFYITLGKKTDIIESDEINEEINKINNIYGSQFSNFKFELYGAKELCDYIELLNDKSIDAKIEIVCDANVPSIIERNSKNIKSLVCSIKASELIKLLLHPKSIYLFEQNVRKYLEDRSKVNSNIINTAGGEDSEYFWALNNGVTIICKKYEKNILGSIGTVEMQNLQIINGCQTTMALYKAYETGNLNENTSLLLRIHETDDESIIDKIIVSTNNQNPINPKDLLSNSIEQIELQKYFSEIYGVVYQRKRNDFRDIYGNSVSKKEIITNDKVGQAALACIKSMPNIALGSKGRIFTKDKDIFNKNKEKIACSFFIHEKVLQFSKNIKVKADPELASILKFGRFHITYIIYKLYERAINVEFNKNILHDDINLDEVIYLLLYILNNDLSKENKSNLLAHFKTKDSVNSLTYTNKKFIEVVQSIENIKTIISKDINVIDLCDNEMVLLHSNYRIKFNYNGTINTYIASKDNIEEDKKINMLNILPESLKDKTKLCYDNMTNENIFGVFEIDPKVIEFNKVDKNTLVQY